MTLRLFFIVMVFIAAGARAQTFSPKVRIPLPVSWQVQKTAWADLNNDSILDIVVAAKENKNVNLYAFKNPKKGVSTPILLSHTPFKSVNWSITDIDHNGTQDIIVTGLDTLAVIHSEKYLNSGSFIFHRGDGPVLTEGALQLEAVDLNNDTREELVFIRDTEGFSIRDLTGRKKILDTMTVSIADFVIYDFDGNGFNDIALSGEDDQHRPFITILELKNAFDTLRTIRIPAPLTGHLRAGDINHDGLFDLIAAGKDSVGRSLVRSYTNRDSLFRLVKTRPGVTDAELEIADLDSDGKSDLIFHGNDSGGNPINRVVHFSGDSVSLPYNHLLNQEFGDFDRDGDLDLLQLHDTLALVILENQEPVVNKTPTFPTDFIGAFVLNRVFFFWKPAADDHTPGAALTYDLLITGTNASTNGAFLPGEYDRTLVAHGNRTTAQFALVRVPNGSYTGNIQAVDNSFLGSAGVGGVCTPGLCIQMQQQVITSCQETPVQIKTAQPVMWFSFSKGFIGIADSLRADPKTDTIFSFIPQSGNACNALQLYNIIQLPKDTLTITDSKTSCEGKAVTLTTPTEWSDIIWKDGAESIKGTGTSIPYTITKDETLIATGHNGQGCFMKQTETLHISKPNVTVHDDHIRIMKGDQANLSASGASTYSWQPPTGLSNSLIPDPSASPALTTSYTVTGYDSLGCSGTASVLVEVEDTAFVPNLFTPNGDGKNDELKIYGLTHAREFHFAVYNREGSVVFESNDLTTVVSRGWDGSRQGIQQPPGLYYWKIEGTYDNGSPLYLNGKTKGSILLVR